MRILSIAGATGGIMRVARCTVVYSVYNSTKARDIACSLYCGCHLEPRGIFNAPYNYGVYYCRSSK